MDSIQENSPESALNESKELESTTEKQQALEDETNEQIISDEDIASTLSDELFHGWKLVTDLLSNQFASITWPFREPVDTDKLGLWDYYDKIKQPMCLIWIKKKFYDSSYTNITEVINDIRLMIENCYRYNGSKHWISKLGQKLEKTIEQKVNLFPRSLRDKLRSTNCNGEDNDDIPASRRRSNRSTGGTFEFTTSIVARVKLEEEEEEKNKRRQKVQEAKEASLAIQEEINNWQKEYAPSHSVEEIRSYWQVPAIAQLFFLCQESLNLRNVCLEELELGLIMPHRSYLISRIFSTLLLDPKPRQYLDDKKAMPYNVWDHKLKDVMKLWYDTKDELNEEMVINKFGLASDLFKVLGDKHEILTTPFHELSIRKRVYLLKALCDFVTEIELKDILTQYGPATLREIVLGQDDKGATYFYFPGFLYLDLRVYKHDPVNADILKRKKQKVCEKPIKEIPTPKVPHKRPERLRQLRSSDKEPAATQDKLNILPKPQATINTDSDFELLCDSCDSLNELCENLTPIAKRRSKSNPDSAVKHLLETLKQLHSDILPWDYKLQRTQARIKNKLMRECANPLEEVPVEDWKEPTRISKKKEEKIVDIDDVGSHDDSISNISVLSYSNDSIAEDRSVRQNRTVKIKEDEDESIDSTNTNQQVAEPVTNGKRKRKLAPKPNIWESSLEAVSTSKAKTVTPSTIASEGTSIVTSMETSCDDDDKEYLIGVPAKKALPSISYTPPPNNIKPYYKSSGTTGGYANSPYSKDDGINANPVQAMYSHAQSTGTLSQSSSVVNANIDITESSPPNVNYSVPYNVPQTPMFQNSNMNINNQNNMYHRNNEVYPNYARDQHNNNNNNSYYPPINNNYNNLPTMPRQDNCNTVNGGQRLQTAYNLVQFSSQRQYPEASQDNSNKKPYIDPVDYSNNYQYSNHNSVDNYNHNVTKDSQLNANNYTRNLYQQNLWTPHTTNLNSNFQN